MVQLFEFKLVNCISELYVLNCKI